MADKSGECRARNELLSFEDPDFLMREEIAGQLKTLTQTGTLLATAVPRLEIVE